MTVILPHVHESCLTNRRRSSWDGIDFVEIDQAAVEKMADEEIQQSIIQEAAWLEKSKRENR